MCMCVWYVCVCECVCICVWVWRKWRRFALAVSLWVCCVGVCRCTMCLPQDVSVRMCMWMCCVGLENVGYAALDVLNVNAYTWVYVLYKIWTLYVLCMCCVRIWCCGLECGIRRLLPNPFLCVVCVRIVLSVLCMCSRYRGCDHGCVELHLCLYCLLHFVCVSMRLFARCVFLCLIVNIVCYCICFVSMSMSGVLIVFVYGLLCACFVLPYCPQHCFVCDV